MADTFDSFSFTEWETALEGPSDSFSDDGREFHELKLSSKLTKTNEEIMTFSVDESLNDIERALYLINKGQAVQKISVLNGFPRLFEEYPEQAIKTVLPAITKVVVSTERNVEFQLAVSNFLEDFLSIYPCTTQTSKLILDTCKTMMKSDIEAVFQGYSKVYLSCIVFGLDKDVLISIVKSAKTEGGFTQPTSSRIWGGKVLCCSACHFTSDEIESLFLDKVLVLCQDTDQEVRCCMGKYLCHLVKHLNPSLITEKIMPEFIELVKDEERDVRIASLEGLSHSLDYLSEDQLKQFVLPAFFHLILTDSSLKKVISKELGRFIWFCHKLFSDPQKEKLLSFYETLSMDPTQDIPFNCCYNLPAILKCMQYVPPLTRVVQNLIDHPGIAIQIKFATCFSILGDLVRPNTYLYFKDGFFKLFNKEPNVFQPLVSQLQAIMDLFLADPSFKKGTHMEDFIIIVFRKLRSFVDTKKWLLAQSLLQQLQSICDSFSLDHIYDIGVPILRRIVHESLTIPLKQLALKVLIIYARKFRKIEHRESVCRTLVSDLAFSTDFQKRLLFLRLCEEVFLSCSFKFFRQYFAHAFLALSSDAVHSVRRKMASLMPFAFKAISLPGVDEAIIKKLGQAKDELMLNGMDLEFKEATFVEKSRDQSLSAEEMASIKEDLECRQRFLDKDKKKPLSSSSTSTTTTSSLTSTTLTSTTLPTTSASLNSSFSGSSNSTTNPTTITATTTTTSLATIKSKSKKSNTVTNHNGLSFSMSGPTLLESLKKKIHPISSSSSHSSPLGSNESFSESAPSISKSQTLTSSNLSSSSSSPPSSSFNRKPLSSNIVLTPPTMTSTPSTSDTLEVPVRKEKPPPLKPIPIAKRIPNR